MTTRNAAGAPWVLTFIMVVGLGAAFSPVAEAATVAYWEFEEGSGTSADSSVGGWTGTLVNFPDTSAGAGDVPGVAGWTSDGRLNFDRESGQPGAARVDTDSPRTH